MLRLLVAASLLSPSILRADDGFDSDRPGFANSTAAAPPGRPITELGADAAWDEDAPAVGTLPNLRIRLGVAPGVEVRVDAPTLRLQDPLGLGGLTLGFKLARAVGGSFAVSLIPSVSLSIGTEAGVVTGGLECNWSAAVGILGFGGNLVARVVTVAGARRAHGEGSLAVSVGATPALTLFAQGYARWTRGRKPRPYVGLGAYARVHPRVQVDVFADVGLSDAATRLRVGAGLTVLWGRDERAPVHRNESEPVRGHGGEPAHRDDPQPAVGASPGATPR